MFDVCCMKHCHIPYHEPSQVQGDVYSTTNASHQSRSSCTVPNKSSRVLRPIPEHAHICPNEQVGVQNTHNLIIVIDIPPSQVCTLIAL